MSEGHWFVIRTADDWARQARTALDDIKQANGGTRPANLRASRDVSPEAFSVLVEALVALGIEVDDEMIALAGLRDVGEYL